jgi:hypothetical protein
MRTSWHVLASGALGDTVLTIQLAKRIPALRAAGGFTLVSRTRMPPLAEVVPAFSYINPERLGLHWLYADTAEPPSALAKLIAGSHSLSALGPPDSDVHRRLQLLHPTAVYSFDPRPDRRHAAHHRAVGRATRTTGAGRRPGNTRSTAGKRAKCRKRPHPPPPRQRRHRQMLAARQLHRARQRYPGRQPGPTRFPAGSRRTGALAGTRSQRLVRHRPHPKLREHRAARRPPPHRPRLHRQRRRPHPPRRPAPHPHHRPLRPHQPHGLAPPGPARTRRQRRRRAGPSRLEHPSGAGPGQTRPTVRHHPARGSMTHRRPAAASPPHRCHAAAGIGPRRNAATGQTPRHRHRPAAAEPARRRS